MTEAVSVNDLLERAKASDVEAFGVLYAEYYEVFYRAARNRGLSHHDAEDVVQETFIKIAKNVKRYNPKRAGPSEGRGWLFRIYQNTIIDWFRRQKLALPLADMIIASSIELERYIENEEVYRTILCALLRMESKHRQKVLHPGRGPRGPYHAALQQFRFAFLSCFQGNPA